MVNYYTAYNGRNLAGRERRSLADRISRVSYGPTPTPKVSLVYERSTTLITPHGEQLLTKEEIKISGSPRDVASILREGLLYGQAEQGKEQQYGNLELEHEKKPLLPTRLSEDAMIERLHQLVGKKEDEGTLSKEETDELKGVQDRLREMHELQWLRYGKPLHEAEMHRLDEMVMKLRNVEMTVLRLVNEARKRFPERK